MGISVSLLLIAAGLILLIATTLSAIGWILLIVGIVGIVLSMIFWSAWGGFGGAGAGRRTPVIEKNRTNGRVLAGAPAYTVLRDQHGFRGGSGARRRGCGIGP